MRISFQKQLDFNRESSGETKASINADTKYREICTEISMTDYSELIDADIGTARYTLMKEVLPI